MRLGLSLVLSAALITGGLLFGNRYATTQGTNIIYIVDKLTGNASFCIAGECSAVEYKK